MGNQGSSNAGCAPAYSRYKSSTILDSFFDESAQKSSPQYTSQYAINFTGHCTEITFQASNGPSIRRELGVIEMHAGALIPEDWNPGRTVYLREKSTVLRVLFQFIGPHKHPNLLKEDFEFVAELARAAQKYLVFSALNPCSERMREFCSSHPRLVLQYATHNDHHHIIDECAPHVVTSVNLEHITPLLPRRFQLPWIQYHAKWSKALTKITSYPVPQDAWVSSSRRSSKCWRHCGQHIFQALAFGVHSLNDTTWIFVDRVEDHTSSCMKCATLCIKWKEYAEKVIKDIGAFSNFFTVAEGSIHSLDSSSDEMVAESSPVWHTSWQLTN